MKMETISTQVIEIEFARCVQWTRGKLDCVPWSKYEIGRETVSVIAMAGLVEDTVDYVVRAGSGMAIGEGSTAAEAICAAQYDLMNSARRLEQRRAISG